MRDFLTRKILAQYLVSAPPKTGKTLWVVELIFRILHKEPNRHIVTNIIGMNIPGVVSVTSTLNRPLDWRDYPNGTVFIFDEAHEHPAFTSDDLIKNVELPYTQEREFNIKEGLINNETKLPAYEKKEKIAKINAERKKALHNRKEEIRDIARSLTLHGHFGFDIYLITQDVRRMNDVALAATNQHIILRRLWGLKFCLVYKFAEVQRSFTSTSRRNSLSVSFYRHKSYLYKYYISAEQHNTKKEAPVFLILLLLAIAILAFFAYKKLSEGRLFGSPKSVAQESNDTKQITKELKQYTKQEANGLTAKQILVKNDVDSCVSGGKSLEICRQFYDDEYVPNSKAIDTMNQVKENHGPEMIAYDPSQPYEFKRQLQYEVVNKPKFSGCIKFNRQYKAYTEQGTVLNVSSDVCKRLLEKNERPYDYFNERNKPVQKNESDYFYPKPQVYDNDAPIEHYAQVSGHDETRVMISDKAAYKNYHNAIGSYR